MTNIGTIEKVGIKGKDKPSWDYATEMKTIKR
jgi:hypothetical protein